MAEPGARDGEEDGAVPEDAQAQQDQEPHSDDGLDLARELTRATAGSAAPSTRRRRRPRSEITGRPVPRVLDRSGGWSGPGPDERDPRPLATSFERMVEDRGWALDLQVRGVFARWAEIVGPSVAEHATPETLVDGVLAVRTDSTAWATELKLLAPTIVRRLCDELGDGTVRVVDVKGPQGPSWRHGSRRAAGGRGPRDTYG